MLSASSGTSMLNVYQSNAGLLLSTKSSLAVGDPSALQDTAASTVHKLLRSQDGTHGFWIQGNEMFAGARILSSNTGETLSSALNSETATGFEIYANKPASQSGSPASTQRYTFSIDGVQKRRC